MSISTNKTSANGINLQYEDLPPVTLITGKEWRPSEKQILQWNASYPDTDLPGELRRIEDWFQKHPDRRKTERSMDFSVTSMTLYNSADKFLQVVLSLEESTCS